MIRPVTRRAAFGYDGIVRVVTGAGAGGFVPLALDLTATPTTEVFGTGTGNDVGSEQYPASRFEQSMVRHRHRAHRRRDAIGARRRATVTVRGARATGASPSRSATCSRRTRSSTSSAHRSSASAAADTCATRRACVNCAAPAGTIEYDDAARTIAPARLKFETADGDELDVELVPASPSISFDMAHTCEVPEHWLYWRILVDARGLGLDGLGARLGRGQPLRHRLTAASNSTDPDPR